MVLTERSESEVPPTAIQRVTSTLIITVENPDAYGGHLQHYEAQEILGNQREEITESLRKTSGQTYGITDPANDVRSIDIEYKKQLFGGEEVEVTTDLCEPDPNQQGLTFNHQVIQSGEPVIIATVNCGPPDQGERINFQKELEGLEPLTSISTKGPIGQKKDMPHYTDSQRSLNKDRIDIFESCGAELRNAAELTNLFGFITTMKIEYLEQPGPNDEVEITTDVYRHERTIFRFHQRIIKAGVVITESIANCAIVNQKIRKPVRLPKELLAKLRTHHQISLLLESAGYPELEGARQLFKLGDTKEALKLLDNYLTPESDRASEILSSPEKYYQSRADTNPEDAIYDDIKLIAAIMAAMNDDYRGLTLLAELLITQSYERQLVISSLLAQLTESAKVKIGQKDKTSLTREQIFEWAMLIHDGKVKLTPAQENDEIQNTV